MSYWKEIHQSGVVHATVKTGEKERVKNAERIEKKNRIKEICLNCTEAKCKTTTCKAFMKKGGAE